MLLFFVVFADSFRVALYIDSISLRFVYIIRLVVPRTLPRRRHCHRRHYQRLSLAQAEHSHSFCNGVRGWFPPPHTILALVLSLAFRCCEHSTHSSEINLVWSRAVYYVSACSSFNLLCTYEVAIVGTNMSVCVVHLHFLVVFDYPPLPQSRDLNIHLASVWFSLHTHTHTHPSQRSGTFRQTWKSLAGSVCAPWKLLIWLRCGRRFLLWHYCVIGMGLVIFMCIAVLCSLQLTNHMFGMQCDRISPDDKQLSVQFPVCVRRVCRVCLRATAFFAMHFGRASQSILF